MIPLGSKIKDNITGYQGIATARVTHLYGCVHIAIQPQELKDGIPQKERLFDEQRIQIIERAEREPQQPKFDLGSTVRDKITGLVGIVTVWVDELNGNTTVNITPKILHEGKPVESINLPEDRVELIEATKPEVSPDSSATSGSIEGYSRPSQTRESASRW